MTASHASPAPGKPPAEAEGLTETSPRRKTRSHARWVVLAFIFVVTAVNYADRSSMSIAGTPMAKELGINAIQLGYLFSAFGWAYAAGQIPGGWLLDRFGSKLVYGLSIVLWSLVTFAASLAGVITATVAAAVAFLFTVRFVLGLVESPAFPGNNRLVAAWFPTAERGCATSIFNSAQYFAFAAFTPAMAWVVHAFGWRWCFVVLGVFGVVLAAAWWRWMEPPLHHRSVSQSELDVIRDGGGLLEIENANRQNKPKITWSQFAELFRKRQYWGTYIGQYCVTALTFFFTTWFPIYLVEGRGMTILSAGLATAIPAIGGFVGGISGGALSDWLIKRGVTLSAARKAPFIGGMTLAGAIGIANFTDNNAFIISVMALAFFGKGVAAIGWAVISDVASPKTVGLAGSVFNGLGNIAGIVTPIAIGYIVGITGSFYWALWVVTAHCVVGIAGYLFMGKIERKGMQ